MQITVPLKVTGTGVYGLQQELHFLVRSQGRAHQQQARKDDLIDASDSACDICMRVSGLQTSVSVPAGQPGLSGCSCRIMDGPCSGTRASHA